MLYRNINLQNPFPTLKHRNLGKKVMKTILIAKFALFLQCNQMEKGGTNHVRNEFTTGID